MFRLLIHFVKNDIRIELWLGDIIHGLWLKIAQKIWPLYRCIDFYTILMVEKKSIGQYNKDCTRVIQQWLRFIIVFLKSYFLDVRKLRL